MEAGAWCVHPRTSAETGIASETAYRVVMESTTQHGNWPATVKTMWDMPDDDRPPGNNPGRIVRPTKWVVQVSASRSEGKPPEPRVPIPSSTEPPWAPPSRTPAVLNVDTSGFYVGLGQVVRTQAAPAIQVIGLHQILLIELLRLQLTRRIQRKFPSS